MGERARARRAKESRGAHIYGEWIRRGGRPPTCSEAKRCPALLRGKLLCGGGQEERRAEADDKEPTRPEQRVQHLRRQKQGSRAIVMPLRIALAQNVSQGGRQATLRASLAGTKMIDFLVKKLSRSATTQQCLKKSGTWMV